MTAASWYARTDDHARASVSGVGVSTPQKEASSVGYDSTRHRFAPGTRVGDHLVVRGVLGEGGTAVVYEALHTRLGASVALKVVDVSEEYMEGARQRLLREAQVCAGLEDAHIPRIYDVGALEDGTPYVVMERVSGRTLESVIAEGPLPFEVAVNIADDLLSAVEAIEKAGIVHRDIKPPNIILQTTAEGTLRVRLMDFGVSKTVSATPDPSQSNPKLTQQGAIVGTPHYMAPEQIVGPSVDSRADLYGVGVVVYEMLAGRTPFEGQTTGEVVAAVLHTRPLALRKLREVHPALEGWVEKAMAPRRSDRFFTARGMREALKEAWASHQAYAQAAGRRAFTRRARVVGAVALVLLGVVLPLPAGYDLHALARLLTTKQAADEASSAEPPTPAAQQAEPGTASAAIPAQPQALPEGLVPPEAEPVLDEQPTLPQSPPPNEEANAAAPAAPTPVAEPAPMAVEAPAANVAEAERVPPASAPLRAQGRAVVPSARPSAPSSSAAPAPLPPRGVLLNDYLRQLDSQLAPLADPTRFENEERRPSQPAPNPFDGLPDNPYAH